MRLSDDGERLDALEGAVAKLRSGGIMTKVEAIRKIKEIQEKGIDRSAFPEEMKGRLAKRLWNEMEYGMVYGYILALLETFDIKSEEL